MPRLDAGTGFAPRPTMERHEKVLEAYEEALRRGRRHMIIFMGIAALVLTLAVTLIWWYGGATS